MENVSRQYHPQLLGVATTCLAETIGDDVGMSLHEIRKQSGEGSEPLPPVVSVSTPSFAGTHAEGYQATLRAVVEQLAGDGEPRQELNVFSPMISPADQRYLKEIVADFGLASMLLPDYSETLDGPTWEQYQSIPDGGTTLDEIRASGSAKHSVQFSCTADASRMPATFLKDRFGVRAHHLPMPIGIGATDTLFDTLVECSGRPVPGTHQRERGRLIDALVDGHKAVFNRRAAVFGEEDLVVGIVSLLLEVGIVPVLCASGADSGRMARVLQAMTPELGSRVEVMQDTDFADLEARVEAVRPDILIGNSKGYSMSRRLGIPLVRVGFPIHDRIGGARLLHVGYRGAQQLFDRITNTLIEQTQYASQCRLHLHVRRGRATMALDLSKHPCFNDAARHTFGRIHLPVAPKCNIQCNFCDRRFNCVNESRPGVTCSVLTPRQALVYLRRAVERDPRMSVVGIAGPGDPFANADETMETLRLVREHFPRCCCAWRPTACASSRTSRNSRNCRPAM